MGRIAKGNVRRTAAGHYEAYITLGGADLSKTYEKAKDAWDQITRWKNEHIDRVLGREKPAQQVVSFANVARQLKVAKTKRRAWADGMVRWFDGHQKTLERAPWWNRPVHAIAAEEIQDWLDLQVGRPIIRRHGELAGQTSGRVLTRETVRQYERWISMVFAHAVRKGFLAASPMPRVERPPKADEDQVEDERAFTPAEVRAIIEACVTARHRAWFSVLAFAGLRESEARRLKWGWVELEVEAQRDPKRPPAPVLDVKKGKRGRHYLPIGPRLAAALRELGEGDPDQYVFPGFSRAGGGRGPYTVQNAIESKAAPRDATRQLSQGGMRRALRDAMKLAKVDPRGAGFHSFRRCFATALEDREGEGVTKKLLRHGGGSLTWTYVKVEWEKLVGAIARLEQGIMEPLRVLRVVGGP